MDFKEFVFETMKKWVNSPDGENLTEEEQQLIHCIVTNYPCEGEMVGYPNLEDYNIELLIKEVFKEKNIKLEPHDEEVEVDMCHGCVTYNGFVEIDGIRGNFEWVDWKYSDGDPFFGQYPYSMTASLIEPPSQEEFMEFKEKIAKLPFNDDNFLKLKKFVKEL